LVSAISTNPEFVERRPMESNISRGQSRLLRPAEASDIRLLFEWRNEPWIVLLSTSQRAISWAEHEDWFNMALDSSQHLLFIVHTDEGIPAGSLRLDRKESDATISIYLMKPYTGAGLGPRAIDAGCRSAFEHWPALKRIVAYIRDDNQPSRKAFTRASFHPAAADLDCPPDHVALARGRE
jgi:RimJ/RimL family protein N-acetyltransferase